MTDLPAPELADDDRELLLHPLVGGVVLFERNYLSPGQLQSLVAQIKSLRRPGLLVAVDHEGGRVQRFRDGFTRLPSAAVIGGCYQRDRVAGLQLAEQTGWLMAVELRAVGIDFSFAPVLDVGTVDSQVVGDRSFHQRPGCVADLAQAYVQGMRNAGMAAVGKHFPGHGGVSQDSHLLSPADDRPLEVLEAIDLVPFTRLIGAGIEALMPAHVIYTEVDDKPACFSPVWLHDILRQRLQFNGSVFSDDINMAGAAVMGDHVDRARSALVAGCDMVLVCNDRLATTTVLDKLAPVSGNGGRLVNMYGRQDYDIDELKHNDSWQLAVKLLGKLNSDACC